MKHQENWIQNERKTERKTDRKKKKRKKAEEKNLQPLDTPSSKALQYGDTSLNSISTDDTVWSHGVCLNISKYEGKFLVKRGMSSKKVIEKTRIQNHYSSCL